MGQVGIAGITAIDTADPYQRLSAALIISAVTASQQGDPEAQRWLESCALQWLWLIMPLKLLFDKTDMILNNKFMQIIV